MARLWRHSLRPLLMWNSSFSYYWAQQKREILTLLQMVTAWGKGTSPSPAAWELHGEMKRPSCASFQAMHACIGPALPSCKTVTLSSRALFTSTSHRLMTRCVKTGRGKIMGTTRLCSDRRNRKATGNQDYRKCVILHAGRNSPSVLSNRNSLQKALI